MSSNDYEDKWEAINNEIRAIEAKEEEFAQVSQKYARELEEFQHKFRQLSTRNNELLASSIEHGNKQARDELEAAQEMSRTVDAYIEGQMEAIANARRTLQNESSEAREQLQRERDNLT